MEFALSLPAGSPDAAALRSGGRISSTSTSRAARVLVWVNSFANVPPFVSNGGVSVIIDTPKGSRNKYKLNEELGLFELGGVEPAGMFFPFDFGFIPGTRGGDGDPLDVLVLLDEPTFVGCLIASRLIGVIEAEQTEKGKTTRNDRLVAVAATSRNHRGMKQLSDLDKNLVAEIEHFFVAYNDAKGKRFNPLARRGPKAALELVRKSCGI